MKKILMYSLYWLVFGITFSLTFYVITIAVWNSSNPGITDSNLFINWTWTLTKNKWNALVWKVVNNHGKQLFTWNWTFSVPAWVWTVWISMAWWWWGGGWWSNIQSSQYIWAAWGWWWAAYFAKQISVTPWESVSVTIGAWWSWGAGWSNWVDGWTTSFGSYVSCSWWKGWSWAWWTPGGAAGWAWWSAGMPSVNDWTNGQIWWNWWWTIFWAWWGWWANGSPFNWYAGWWYWAWGWWAGSLSTASWGNGSAGFVLVEW